MTIEERAASYAIEEDDGWCVKDSVKEQAYIKGATEQREIDEEELKPQWISVDDRLPEQCKNVLAFDGVIRDCYYEDGEFIAYDGNLIQPTHWMPLPEPPKK